MKSGPKTLYNCVDHPAVSMATDSTTLPENEGVEDDMLLPASPSPALPESPSPPPFQRSPASGDAHQLVYCGFIRHLTFVGYGLNACLV